MIRSVSTLLLAAGFVLASAPGFAQTADAPRHIRKAAKPRKVAPAPSAPASGGINTPSTDFSKIERPDEDQGPNGPIFRPTMGSGGMGLGAGF